MLSYEKGIKRTQNYLLVFRMRENKDVGRLADQAFVV